MRETVMTSIAVGNIMTFGLILYMPAHQQPHGRMDTRTTSMISHKRVTVGMKKLVMTLMMRG
jgi:hypothetical protein